MKFCPECNNLLISKNKTVFCKTCGMSFEVKPNEKSEFILVKKMNNDDKDLEPFVLKNDSRKRSNASDFRKAYEDYFVSSE